MIGAILIVLTGCTEEIFIQYEVVFYDANDHIIKTEIVEPGYDITPPTPPVIEGKSFIKWDQSYHNIRSNMAIRPIYEVIYYTVVFFDGQGDAIKTESVAHGATAEPPIPPVKEGHTFTEWDQSYEAVQSNIEVHPLFEINYYHVIFYDANMNVLKIDVVRHGEAAEPPDDPVKEGHVFDGWNRHFSYIVQDREILPRFSKYIDINAIAAQIHYDYWLKLALLALESDPHLFAIYQSRSLAVKHPEIYLQGDSIFNRYLTDASYFGQTGNTTWEFYQYRGTDLLRQSDDFKDERFTLGDTFSWDRFDVTAHQPIPQQSLYENEPFFAFVDMRLHAMASALKGLNWSATSISLASFQYFEYRELGMSPFIIMTSTGDAFLSLDGNQILDDQGNEVTDINDNIVLIFSESYVWYPLMQRDDRLQSAHLRTLVERFEDGNNLPELSAEEAILIEILRNSTALDDETTKLLAMNYAAKLHVFPWFHLNEFWEVLYKEETFYAGTNRSHFTSLHTFRNSHIARLSNYLNPLAAQLAAMVRAGFESNQSLNVNMTEMVNALLDSVETNTNPRSGNLTIWFHSEQYYWNLDDTVISKASNCIMSSSITAAIIDMADVDDLFAVIIGIPGHAYAGVYYNDQYGVIENFRWAHHFSGLSLSNSPVTALVLDDGWVILAEHYHYKTTDIRTSLPEDTVLSLLQTLHSIDRNMRIAIHESHGVFNSININSYIERILEGVWDKQLW